MPTKKRTKRSLLPRRRGARETPRYAPLNRRPTTPGEMLLEDYIKPLGLTQTVLAERLGISPRQLGGIIRGRRAVTAKLALLLGREFKTTPYFWLGLQMEVDLWDACHSSSRGVSAEPPYGVNGLIDFPWLDDE